MRLSVLALAVAVATVFVTSALAAEMTSAAKKELDTAIFHANAAAGYNNTKQIELHLHHVVNCIEGKDGKNYFAASGDVCEGMGNGLLKDLQASGMAGGHALPYVELAQSVSLWG